MPQLDAADLSTQTFDRARAAATWPLLAAIVFWAVGLTLAPTLDPVAATSIALITALALAVLATLPAALVLGRSLNDPVILPFAGLTAVAATLLALAPLDRSGIPTDIAGFLLTAPWRYALPPLLVHFALEIGWQRRRPQWVGWLLGWYAIQAGMLVAAATGMALGERPLVDAVDGTVRIFVLEPAGVLIALAAAIAPLVTPMRGRTLRTALLWTVVAIAGGVGPLLLMEFVPGVSDTFIGTLSLPHIALLLLPIGTAMAVFALPFRDDATRDFAAYRMAAALLDETDLSATARQLAETLRRTFSARGVMVRFATPPTAVAVGDIAPAVLQGPMASGAESGDDRNELVMPIGRSIDPLGDIRVEGRYAGGFGTTEREWITAFLRPIATVLRARHRELAATQRYRQLSHRLGESVGELARAADRLPQGASDAGMAVPPAVDAREVLAQLSDGVTGVARHGEGLLAIATEARDRARGASDTIARALDRLGSLGVQVNRVTRHGEEIAASNDSVSGVAFRTNLVANNAALEATRAGPAGRTFGVLAEEVRRLADTTAATSEAIGQRTLALSQEVVEIGTALDLTRHALGLAIREAEAAEVAAQRLNEAALELEDVARSLRPAVEEANAVAKRRSARDQHLTLVLERFLTERSALARSLAGHRDAMTRLAVTLGAFEHEGPPAS